MTVAGARATSAREPLPSGTVTFLFTDIEGSTRVLASVGDAYEGILEEHRRRIREAVAAAGGHEVNTEGDALFIVFGAASAAVAAAAQAQRNLSRPWPDDIALNVRMGIHTGEATLAGGDYVGLEVHRAARVGAAGHGGQVILSSATRSLVEDRLPAGVTLRDLGEHRLKDLARAERLTQLVIDGLRNDFPPPRTLDATPNNLPVQLTSFVGRTELLAEAMRLLDRNRLLTLTGPGGTGKTRLALEIAAEVAPQLPDGVFFVPLAPLADPTLVAPTIAATVGMAPSGGRPPLEQLLDGLRNRRTLLVLDNFEQLLAAAPVLSELLRGTEHLKLIVTSRAVLRVSGEQELPVPPLGLPDPHGIRGAAALSQYDAVRLFIERAVAARPGFAVTNENAPAVAEITARLDGLPLAIELAAARLRLLTPQAILARLGDRLGLLSGGARDLPERQQTLRAAIAWSYDLLASGERDLFERAGVFMGGWSLEAAEAIGAVGDGPGMDVLDGLASLAEKSLLRPQEDAHGDSRFLMLETIRAFAVERLDARPDVSAIRERHATWYLDFAEATGANLGGGDRRDRLTRLEDDHDNIRAALAWFMDRHRLGEASRLIAAVWRFWQQRGHLIEARMRADALLDADDRVHVLTPGDRFAALTAAGGISYWQGDVPAVHVRYRDALAIARVSGTKAELAEALYNFSFAPAPGADRSTWFTTLAVDSPPYAREAAELFREIGDTSGEARALWGLADYLLYGHDYVASEQVLGRALALFRSLGDRFGEAWTYHTLGLAHFRLGDLALAAGDLDAALGLHVEAGDVSGITLTLLDIAGIAHAADHRDDALALAGAGDALGARTGTGLGEASLWNSDALPALPPRPVEGPDFERWREGAALSVDEAVALAREALARVRAGGDPVAGR